ncbi:hypothetical protein BDF19DRAFT_388063 [Syncephalis fuscata]|nr:hypothetical protein BDF19DRAFT_388063 [Syncephalis fuscata]
MPPQRRSRVHKNNKAIKKAHRTRRRTKDILLKAIHDDLLPENVEKLKNQPLDADLPGLGQHYCVECSRYFVSTSAMEVHVKSKAHKKRLRELKDEPYTLAEAEAAVGLTTENRRPTTTVTASTTTSISKTAMAMD